MNQSTDAIHSFQLRSINPIDGTTVKSHPELTASELTAKLEKLNTVSKVWGQSPLIERLQLIQSIKSALVNNKDYLAKTITLETGKPISQSFAEVDKCTALCDYYFDTAPALLEPTIVETAFQKSYYILKPIGTILLIMPWNYPVWQVFRAVIPALALGNNIALKHAGNVQLCAQAIEKTLIDAGIPDGVFSNLPIEERLTQQTMEHAAIKGVSLTGSVKAGRSVASAAGKRLMKTVMELGGNDPLIVFKDANLIHAAQTAVSARLINCGQVCVAPKRIIVDKNVHDEFVGLVLEGISKYKPSDPNHVDCNMGPMARKDLLNSFNAKLNQTREQGAKCLYGGNIIKSDGFWHEPTLLTHVARDSPAATGELFGPSLCLYSVDSENEAIEFANQSKLGLGASLFTQDIEKAERLALDSIRAGAVFINNPVKSNPKLPFGGVGESGYGRELGPHGLSEFANVKTIAIK